MNAPANKSDMVHNLPESDARLRLTQSYGSTLWISGSSRRARLSGLGRGRHMVESSGKRCPSCRVAVLDLAALQVAPRRAAAFAPLPPAPSGALTSRSPHDAAGGGVACAGGRHGRVAGGLARRARTSAAHRAIARSRRPSMGEGRTVQNGGMAIYVIAARAATVGQLAGPPASTSWWCPTSSSTCRCPPCVWTFLQHSPGNIGFFRSIQAP
jgi:hypothetical protein